MSRERRTVLWTMDAAGTDATIKHVMSGVNPQGVQVFSFKAPSSEDLDHNFLWRCMKALSPDSTEERRRALAPAKRKLLSE
jgi:polyphosphate kinase 2 (PPK2 family)